MENWLNVPNTLTIIRLLMVFVMPSLFHGDHFIAALVVFLVAGATDLLDGYIARKNDLITDFGKLMDPLADKLMLLVTLLLFVQEGWMPLVIFILVAAKELIMIFGGIFLYNKRDTVVYSNIWGKLATACFTVAVVLTFLHDQVYPVNLIVMWAAFGLSVVAFVNYGLKFVLGKKNKD